MDNIKKLDALVLKATSQSVEQVPQPIYKQILDLVNSRADMPKHAIASISKRMILKNKKVIINIFKLLEYLAYQCELSLYTQISTKQFLFKISGLLTNKQIDQEAKNKAMETVYCWQQLFRPHEDLLPLFFQFYAGMLRNGFDIPHQYKSQFRPSQLKQYKKVQSLNTGSKSQSVQNKKSIIPEPTITEQKTFEQIREKLILTNEIIDSANPAENVKDKELLLQMIQQLKQCQKKVNKTINENPNEKIMQLALAANDDIFITYRRFKDLQRNKKPQPFILTELVSDIHRQSQIKRTQSQIQNQARQKPVQTKIEQKTSKQVDILSFDEPTKPVQKKSSKQQQNIFDMDFQPQPVKKQAPKNTGGDIFDLLGQSQQSTNTNPSINKNQQIDLMDTNYQPVQPVQPVQPLQQGLNFYFPQEQQQPVIQKNNSGTFDDLLLTSSYQGVPPPSGFGITLSDNSLNANDFKTQADLKNYNNKTVIDKFEELTYQFLKK